MILVVVLTTLLFTETACKPTGEWCHLLNKVIQHHADHTTSRNFFSSLEKAKKACAKDAGCGAVGLDRIPYRKVAGGPVIHAQTIYLVSVEDVETRDIQTHIRYNTFIMGACEDVRGYIAWTIWEHSGYIFRDRNWKLLLITDIVHCWHCQAC